MRGSISDIFGILFIFFVIGVGLLIWTKVGGVFDTQLQAMPNVPAEAKTATHDFLSMGYGTLWGIFPFAFFGFYLIALLLASQVPSHPIFLPFSIIIAGIVILIGGILSLAYTTLANTPQFLSVIGQYPNVDFIFQNYAFIAAIMAVIMMVVLYSRRIPLGGQPNG
jgi:hypothetical protein